MPHRGKASRIGKKDESGRSPVLLSILEAYEDIEVTATAADGRTALTRA